MDFRHLLTTRKPSLKQRLVRWTLRLASLPYSLVIRGRNAAYDWRWFRATRSPLGVVSIGNLTVGGTGKSPLVAWLARWFRARRVRVAVLSRGYGSLANGQNDEALELELQLPDVPHLQHWDRVASAKLAEEELEMELLLLDDGFQHRRLARDLEIVLVDASDPPAARWLLPGGLMREPLSSLRRADVILLTRTTQLPPAALSRLQQEMQRRAPGALIALASHRPSNLWVYPDHSRPVSELQGKRVLAFCAIGNPNSFFQSLRELGAEVLDSRTWRDHHVYTSQDIGELAAWTEQFPAAEQIVCTMKDWVKIQELRLGQLELAAVRIELELLSGLAELEVRLERLLPSRLR